MTATVYDDEFATRVISAIETRIERKLKSGALIQYTWGQVSSVANDGQTAGVFFYGETDLANESGAVRLPGATFVTVGDAVKVAIDYATGDRWVVEVDTPVGEKLITVDTDTGSIRLGSVGASSDLTLSLGAAGRLDLTAISPGIALNSGSGNYGYLEFFNSTGAARVIVDYGTGATDDFRLGLFSGAAGAEVYAEKIRLSASTGQINLTGPDLGAVSVAVANFIAPGSATSVQMNLQVGATVRGTIRASSSDNIVINPRSAGATYLSWDTGSGGVIFGNGAGVEVARVTSGGVLDGFGVIATDGSYYCKRAAGSNQALWFGVTNDANAMFYSSTDGDLMWGVGGASALDTVLGRGAANRLDLATGDSFNVVGGGGSYMHTATQVVGSRKTGWGAPTGTPTRTTFVTSTVTLPLLAERVKALIDDLTTHGLIGA